MGDLCSTIRLMTVVIAVIAFGVIGGKVGKALGAVVGVVLGGVAAYYFAPGLFSFC